MLFFSRCKSLFSLVSVLQALFALTLFLWLQAISQFFGFQIWLLLPNFAFSFWLAYKYGVLPRESVVIDKKWLWSIPLLLPIIWQAVRVVYDKEDAIWILNPNNYGDLPYHVGLSTYLKTTSFWPDNFIFSSESLKYPFAVDYLHSQLQFVLPFDFVYPLLSLLFLLLICFLSLRLGGLAFFYLLFCNGNYFSLGTDSYAWKNFLLSIFIPQRGYLLALPIGLLLLHRFWEYYKNNKVFCKIETLIYSFLFGSLAWIHLHSYVFFALFAILLFSLAPTRSFFILLAVSALLGFPFIAQSTDLFQKASTLRFLWIWDRGAAESIGSYALKNFGFLLLSPFFLFLVKDKKARIWLWMQLLLFAFFLICIFSVWPWDNIKFLFWAYAAFFFIFLRELQHKLLKIAIVVILGLPGFYNIYAFTFISPKPLPVFANKEVDLYADWFARAAKDATYIVAPLHNHPVFFYGAKLHMGYDGHLWSHGVDYVATADIYAKFSSFTSEQWKMYAESKKVDYVIVSNYERRYFGQMPGLEGFEKSYSNKDLVIYKIR